MVLEKRRRDLDVDLTLDGALNDRCLVLARRQNRDLAGLENRRDAHRHGLTRNEIFAEEIRRGIASRDRVQHDESSPTLGPGPGLVEPDVPRLPDAEDLKVDSARASDRILVAAALVVHLVATRFALRDVDVLGVDVDVGEQILPHEPPIRVDALPPHRVVLVEVERHDTAEAQPFLAMHAYELAINADWRRTGREPEHRALAGGLFFRDERRDAVRDEPGDVLVIVHDDRADLLTRRRRGMR